MNVFKSWQFSRTVWAGIVGVIVAIANLIGAAYPTLGEDLNGWFNGVAILITSGLAIWGRIKATKQIGTPPGDGSATLPSTGSPLPTSSNGSSWTPLLAIALVLVGGCGMASKAYLTADRATFEAIVPEYRLYVAQDPKLDIASKARRNRTADTWERRLSAAESAAGTANTPPATGGN